MHTEADMEKDLSGPVLRCCDFWYFGKHAVSLSGVSSRLQELGSGMGRVFRVCESRKMRRTWISRIWWSLTGYLKHCGRERLRICRLSQARLAVWEDRL